MDNPFKLISSKVVYQNQWIKVREDAVVRPDGKNGLFGVVSMKSGSTVLALDSNLNALLVREFKYAIDQPSLELVSGGMDASETPLLAAKRELLEETGATASEWVDFGVLTPFTSVVNSPNYMYLALGASFPVQHSSAPGEPLERVVLPFAEVVEMVMRSEITHGASCALILKAARYLKA